MILLITTIRGYTRNSKVVAKSSYIKFMNRKIHKSFGFYPKYSTLNPGYKVSYFQGILMFERKNSQKNDNVFIADISNFIVGNKILYRKNEELNIHPEKVRFIREKTDRYRISFHSTVEKSKSS